MRRTLRFGRAAVFLVALVILGGGVHFLHAYQVWRTASALTAQATAAEAAGDGGRGRRRQ